MGYKSTDPNVKTALRVAEIIELFARERRPLSLSEVARQLGAPASSCLALLRTLNDVGYVYETGRRQGYYPTGRLLAMAQRISEADPVLDKVSHCLQDLCDATCETIIFGRLQPNDKVMFLQVIESPDPIRYVAVPGTQRDAHTNSMGRALLSTMSPEERHKFLTQRPLCRYNDHTLTDPQQIERDIVESLDRGWFQSLGEQLPGVGTISWPIKILGNYYAITIAGPVSRVEPKIADMVQKLRLICATIEQTA